MREQEIIALIRVRDERGLSELLRHYGPMMRYLISPILPSEQDREECLSEAAMRVWDSIGSFDAARGSWSTWLTALTRNAALNRARQRKGAASEELSLDLPSPEPTPEEALLQKERQAELSAALARLSQKDRLLFYRKYYYMQSTAQIASELGMSVRAVVLLILAVLAAGMAWGCLFSASYPMDWQPEEPAESAELSRVREQLLALGFPENVLADLTEEDILSCDGALQVVSEVQDHPVNKGHYLTTSEGYASYTTTVYDVLELRITGVAVELPGEQERWKLFHHFQWVIDPGFSGTECIQLWPAWQDSEGWAPGSDVTGRLLYDRDGQTYTAPYYFLGSQSYTSDSIFWGQQSATDIFAAFSLPNSGENQRGYLSYTAAELADGWIISSWCNYTHQCSALQYPAATAMETRMQGSGNRSGVFLTVQDALQFDPTGPRAELIG